MTAELRPDWYRPGDYSDADMDMAGVYQWSLQGVWVYVGRAKVLRKRFCDYPRNIAAMIEGRPWHGNPAKDYRAIHFALRKAYDSGIPVDFSVLETCQPETRFERKRYWLAKRRGEAQTGGAAVINSDRAALAPRTPTLPIPQEPA